MKIEFYWTSIIGLARTTLALGTLLTLIFNPIDILINTNIFSNIDSIQTLNLFFIFSNNLIVAKLISIIVLLVVVSGFYPFMTGILHWYITYSFFSTCSLIDGGDHVSTILTFLLIPITLTDRRTNHWFLKNYEVNNFRALIGKIFYTLIKIQICAIYFHSFVGKISVDEWLNGTATYYWLTHEYFGINDTIKPVYLFFLSNSFFVTLITWGTLVFEFFLSSSIFMDNRKTKIKLFFFGVFFHLFILITHGLVTFFFAMLSGLLIYLLPNNITVRSLINNLNYVKRNYFNFSI